MTVKNKNVSVILGTRPEAIKMAPVIASLRRGQAKVNVISTGQHEGLMQPVLELFGIRPDINLGVMQRCRQVSDVFGALVSELPTVLAASNPDIVLVHGDTASAAAASTACFLNRIKIGHVEAGLRSKDLHQPWPEEFNRRLIDLVSSIYFAPTEKARDALLAEGVPANLIAVTGNTVVDALLATVSAITSDGALRGRLDREFGKYLAGGRVVLVTSHRRENIGAGLRNICDALARLAADASTSIVWPLHLNPQVRDQVGAALSQVPNIHLIEPVGYLEFIYLMMKCSVILTDSGGVQEEAPSLGKPLVILREVTERPEVVEHGLATIVGTDPDLIVAHAQRGLDRSPQAPGRSFNPFGDGLAAERIVERLGRSLCGRFDDPRISEAWLVDFRQLAGRPSSASLQDSPGQLAS